VIISSCLKLQAILAKGTPTNRYTQRETVGKKKRPGV
jgi:hypothetical protein